jgi:N-acetylglucosamine kinase-like BadF-type ATPase
MPSYVLGINGGHLRSSAIVLCMETQTIVAHANGSALNPHSIEHKDLRYRTGELIASVACELDLSVETFTSRINNAVVSLPGAGLRAEQDEFTQVMKETLKTNNAQVIDDTWAGLYSEIGAPKGICAFAGCGASVCIALGEFAPRKEFKIDGWGPVIGDFGSGFQLVTRFFRNLGRDLDNTRGSAFFDSIRASCLQLQPQIWPELDDLERVQRWFDRFVAWNKNEWRVQFARLAEPILKLADNEADDDASRSARTLVSSVAMELAASIRIAAARCTDPPADTLPLVLQGGILRNSKCYQQTIIAEVGMLFSEIIPARHPPVIGSLLLAANGQLSQKQLTGLLMKDIVTK